MLLQLQICPNNSTYNAVAVFSFMLFFFKIATYCMHCIFCTSLINFVQTGQFVLKIVGGFFLNASSCMDFFLFFCKFKMSWLKELHSYWVPFTSVAVSHSFLCQSLTLSFGTNFWLLFVNRVKTQYKLQITHSRFRWFCFQSLQWNISIEFFLW